MDFTYFIAAFIALVVGFLASLVFVASNGSSKLRLLAAALLASLIINGILLINWTYLAKESVAFVMLDLGFIIAYSLFGSVVGTLPALALRSAWRRLHRHSE